LSGIDNIYNEAYLEQRSNTPFFNVEFICNVDKRQPLSMVQERSLDREGVENIKYKFCFALKLPIICINRKCAMGVGSLHILKLLNLNGGAWRFLRFSTKIINF